MYEAFPVRYFKNAISFKKIFKERGTLSWPKMCIIFCMILAILLSPLPFQIERVNEVNYSVYLPKVMKILDRSELEKIDLKTIGNHKEEIVYKDKNNLLGIRISSEEYSKYENAVILNEHNFIFKERGHLFESKYFFDKKRENNFSVLLKSWHKNNGGILLIFTFVTSSLILSATLILIILGASIFLYLALKYSRKSIRSYRETLGLILNASLLPSLLAMGVGLLFSDITIVTTVYSGGLALMIFVIFLKTKFLDEK